MTLVSICIPYYNQAEWVARTIESVYGQTYPQWELIIVDDGSQEPLPEFWVPDQDVRVLEVTNRGLPNARNVGLLNARGEAFLPLDSDDWIASDYLEKTVPLLAEADVVLTGLQEHGETRNGTYMPGYDRSHGLVDETVLWDFNRFFYCSLFRTSLLRECGGYNGRMLHGYEDWDLWIDLMRRGTRFAAVYEALFHYSTRAESMLSHSERMREEIVAEMHRHHP